MLVDEPFRYRITDFDREVFARFVPDDHPLVLAEERIDWASFRELLTEYYSSNLGQPAIDPVRMLKLEFLKYRHQLSDQQVIARVTTDLAFRQFLQVGYIFRPPDPSSLCRFRARLGEEGFGKVFDALVAQARQAGLVKDRLRLKDASHVVASIAVRSTLTLVAQIRDRLLKAAEAFDAAWAAGQQIEVGMLRARTKEQQDASRLEVRVTHLQSWLLGLNNSPFRPNEKRIRALLRRGKSSSGRCRLLRKSCKTAAQSQSQNAECPRSGSTPRQTRRILRGLSNRHLDGRRQRDHHADQRLRGRLRRGRGRRGFGPQRTGGSQQPDRKSVDRRSRLQRRDAA